MKYRLKLLRRLITGKQEQVKLPHGQNPFDDIKHEFPDYSFNLFFDVGANVGQSVSGIRTYFPNSEIWSFEPIKRNYEELVTNVVDKRVKCFQIGFGAQKSELDVSVNSSETTSDMISLKNIERNDSDGLYEKEIVKIDTLDNFFGTNQVKKVDYLKIDTEGYDFEVLLGAKTLLQNDSISFIETEVSMNPENLFHAKFEDIKHYLEKFDYRLYGIYEQVKEWPTKKPVLRRVNALFLSKSLYSNAKYE